MAPTTSQVGISGSEVRRLMRVHRWTLASFAARWSLTLTRIRHVRKHGLQAGVLAEEWRAMLTGTWSDGTPV